MQAWTLEQVVEALGDEAQIVPGGIIKHHIDATTGRASNVLVAELSSGGFSVTDEGARILEEPKVQVAKEAFATAAAPRKLRRRQSAPNTLPLPAADTLPAVGESLSLDFGQAAEEDLDLPEDFAAPD